MTWLRIDDNFTDHPKIEALTDAAFRAHVRALCYAARFDTEGVVPANALSRMGITKKMLDGFLLARLWEPHADGYMLHDFLDYNLSNEERSKRIAAGKAGANARWNANRIPNGNGKSMAIPRPVPDPDPSRPALPLTPASAGARAARAKGGSKRKRDVVALKAEQATQSPEERYLGKQRAAAFKARTA